MSLLHGLQDLKRKVKRQMKQYQQMQQQMQQMQGQGQEQGEQDPQNQSGKDQEGREQDKFEHMELPAPEEHMTPQEYRKALLEGMSDDVPEEFKALKERYYEELVNQ